MGKQEKTYEKAIDELGALHQILCTAQSDQMYAWLFSEESDTPELRIMSARVDRLAVKFDALAKAIAEKYGKSYSRVVFDAIHED